MATTVEDGSALGAKQPSPACWVTTFVGQGVLRRVDVRFHWSRSASVDDEKVDREPNRTDWSHLMLDARGNGLGVIRSQLDVEW